MNWFKKKLNLDGNDQPRSEQERHARAGNVPQHWFAEGCDQLLSGFGPFGSVTNPIPVNGINGEIIYLNRLRTSNDVGYFFHRPGSIGESIQHVSPRPIDAFELYSLDGKESRTLWFAPYHKWRSTLVPDGCILRPYPTDEREQVFVSTPGHGVTSRLNNFPSGLPLALAESRQLDSIFEGLGERMASFARENLSKISCVPRKDWAQGPLDLGVQENPAGYLVFLLDSNGLLLDTGIVGHGASLREMRQIQSDSNANGEQALLIYALHDEGLLSVAERNALSKVFNVSPENEPSFALHFVLHWLWYELVGRPRTDGTYGRTTGGLVNVHWADLDRPDALFSREVCDILEAVAVKRA